MVNILVGGLPQSN